MLLQPIYDIAEICHRHGISQAVVCPGSRCAPLTLAFSRHTKIQTRTFSDERSAAFIAMGIAQQLNLPTPLVCTSGSAAYNFAPAVAEAFFQQIPLIVFTADRPKEWIDQLDGQTIRQSNIFGSHVKKSFDLPEDLSHPDAQWYVNRVVNEAILLAQEYPKGPVHINIPFREPFYPKNDERITFTQTTRVYSESQNHTVLSKEEVARIEDKLTQFSKVLLVVGQTHFDDNLIRSIDKFTRHHHVVVVADILSNLHSLPQAIRQADVFLGQCDNSVRESLQPDLLITIGKSVLSKNLKLFLRKYRPQEHWHVQPAGLPADTFQSITKVVRVNPESFFSQLLGMPSSEGFGKQKKNNFTRLWEAEEHRADRSKEEFFKSTELTELHFINDFLSELPSRCNLHLANSMSVRYANLIGLKAEQKGIHVFSNRGTSGIDGCTSTAVGHSLTSEVPNILVTGDMAFFYDRNAFWHNYALPHLHVLILNNRGGTIFNMIDGPGQLPELQEYFITNQKLSADYLAKEFNFEFDKVDSSKKVKQALKNFWNFDGKTKILELETAGELNKKAFEQFKQTIKKGYEFKI